MKHGTKQWVELFGAVASVYAVIAMPAAASAADSTWAGGVGKILPGDETVWCVYNAISTSPFTVKARLQKRASDGTVGTDPYTDVNTKLAIEMQCVDANNRSTMVGGNQNFTDNATIQCPANQIPTNVRCMIHSQDYNPFVYGYGSKGWGDPCADGITSINIPSGFGYKGQITGYVSELNFQNVLQPPNPSPYNPTLMRSAQVYGTDMGFMFYAHGIFWAGYGDTWANQSKMAVSPTNTRGNVLFQTFDLDASNGLGFMSYVGANTTGYAREVIQSCHNAGWPCFETSAIPSAGFGLTDGGTPYTVLWFNSIKVWDVLNNTIVSNGGNLAWSNVATGDVFSRGDKTTAVPGKVPPRWSGTSAFGAGAIFQDRYDGYIYLFGQRAYAHSTPIRLARVRAKFASIMDATQYEYWSGSAWVAAPTGSPLAPSELSYFDSHADLIPAEVAAGPEFSVIFDPYVNRFLMLLVSNRSTPMSNTMQVWESRALTGPWQKRSVDFSNLPHGEMSGGTVSPYWFFYGPYANEQILGNGGKTIYYQLSEYNTFDVKPYNVGLWAFDVTAGQTMGCQR